MSDTSPRHIVLADETDLDGFRRAARGLLAQEVAPERVSWSTQAGDRLLDWSGAPTADAGAGGGAAADDSAAGPVKAPAAFVELCQCAILHRDPRRFGLLYRLLWRLLHEPGLRRDPLDHDTMAVHALAQAVRRDLHKMKAFVRFRELRGADKSDTADTADTANTDAVNATDVPASSAARGVAAALITHIAWFEPEHHIVEAVAPFFASRFASVRWAILTPERSVRWDGQRLAFGPGARREDAPPADAGERLWLTYYEHIFNPARLKLAAMQKEMPRRYWRNLPEARLIEPLAARAAVRSEAMVAREAALPRRRLPQTSVKPGATSSLGIESVASGNVGNASSTSTGVAGTTRALATLRKATDRCRECPIGEHATQSVTGEGPPGARLMLVGEQPGDQEDLRGRPFVGPAGQLLDRALADLGWPREAVYVTNAVKHFKFELRGTRRIHKTPGQREAAACLHWLESEIEQVQPQAFVALGAIAARALLGRAVGVTSERGRWLMREDGRRVLVTLHPSALLRLQAHERRAAYALWLADLAHATELLGGR